MSTSDPIRDRGATNTRRALLASVIGGLGAWAVRAFTAPANTLAGSDGDVVLGAANASGTTTKVTVGTAGFSAFWGAATGGGQPVGVRGDTTNEQADGIGVWGNAVAESTGVMGTSAQGIGVFGQSGGLGAGVVGLASDGNATGVHGRSDGGIGVEASSGTGYGLEATSTSGTAAYAGSGNGIGLHAFSGNGEAIKAQASAKTAVLATSTTGRGVWGTSASNAGVQGSSETGVGVSGEAASGTGLLGTSGGGFALRTSGRVRLSKVSGVATIAAGKTSVTVTPGVAVASTSFVLLTPRTNLGARTLWFTVTAPGTITIRMSGTRTSSTPVAWLLLS